jgi:hypothetical protein
MTRTSLLLIVFGGLLIWMAVSRLRRQRLKESYALLFVFTALPFLVISIWPRGVEWLAWALEVEYSTALLIVVTTFLILIVFELLKIVSIQDRKITTLAQMVGILMQKQGLADPNHSPSRTETASLLKPEHSTAEPEPDTSDQAEDQPRPTVMSTHGDPVSSGSPADQRTHD